MLNFIIIIKTTRSYKVADFCESSLLLNIDTNIHLKL